MNPELDTRDMSVEKKKEDQINRYLKKRIGSRVVSLSERKRMEMKEMNREMMKFFKDSQ